MRTRDQNLVNKRGVMAAQRSYEELLLLLGRQAIRHWLDHGMRTILWDR